ncbi:MAG TPA: carboxypeptidase regulatory-like domain-containing protein, partial [Planctomycetota bacterium]|nr:carboxypeptidase regulatory-like domain-containing protein [Planctomycetota bacterium]
MSTRLVLCLCVLAFGAGGFGVWRLLAQDDVAAPETGGAESRRSRTAVLYENGAAAESAPASRPVEGEAPPESVAPQPGSVRGRVVDRGGIPLPAAKVRARLHTPPGERSYALVSAYDVEREADAEGRFAFDVPGGGVYRFSAESEGFAPSFKDSVRPGDDIELILDVGAVLVATLVDKTTGKPVAAADFTLRSTAGGFVKKRRSEADGRVEIRDLPAGAAVVAADHADYVPRTGVETTFEVGAVTTLSVELDPGKSIKGQVLSADEQRPIEGAVVAVGKKKVATDAAGRFTVKGLAPQSHGVQTTAEGFLANERQISLAGTRQFAESEIYLDRGATVKGRVINERGEGVAGAELKLFESWGNRVGEESMWEDWSSRHLKAKTGEDGAFRIAGIMPQEWSQRTLRVRHPDYADAFERAMKIAKKEDEVYVLVTMRVGGAISGRVTDDQARPISGARVELRINNLWEHGSNDDDEPWVEKNLRVAGTDADGAFSFVGLSEGKYNLRVEAKGWSTGFKGDLALQKGARLEAVHVTLEKGEPLVGYVVDGDEKPLAAVNVHVSTKNGWAAALTDAEGTFRIETIPKGPYDVSASKTGYASVQLRKQMPSGDRGLRIVVKRQGVLSGKVIDAATKQPIREAWLTLEKEEPRWGNQMRQWAYASVDKTGAFKLQAETARYRLSCHSQGYVRFRKEDVAVDPDKPDQEPLVVELKRGGAIEGFVRGPDGKPDSATTVYWRRDEPNARYQHAANSEMDGYFFCGDLDAGNYEVLFQRPGLPTIVQNGVFVGGDKPAQVDVQLRGETSLSLAIVYLEAPKSPDGERLTSNEGAPAQPRNPAPRRPPRPRVWVESLSGAPLSLDWQNPSGGEEGFVASPKRWVWMGNAAQPRTLLRDLPVGRYLV